MPGDKIINFPYRKAPGESTSNVEGKPSNVVYTHSEHPDLQPFCFSKFYSVHNKLNASTENIRDLILIAMRRRDMEAAFNIKLTYALIRNRFDPGEILQHNTRILGYLIEGESCNIYYNNITRSIEIRIPKDSNRVDEYKLAEDRAVKISQSIDLEVRSEISRIEFLESLRSRSQD
jgi:hypothetical protein